MVSYQVFQFGCLITCLHTEGERGENVFIALHCILPLQGMAEARNCRGKDWPLIIYYQNYGEKCYSVAANRLHPVSVFTSPKRHIFKGECF